MALDLTPGGTRGASVSSRFLKTLNVPVVALVRLLRGKGLRVAGQPLLLLTTTGVKSGRAHTVPLLGFADGPERWLVVASFGGKATHPAWYVNLVKQPDRIWVEVEGRRLRVAAETVAGAERQVAWERIVATAPVYGDYQARTDRQIPVVRLRLADSSASERSVAAH